MSEQESEQPDHFKPVHFDEFVKMVTYHQETKRHSKDTKSVWFSLAKVKELIEHNDANGIRIYFGRHADDHGLYPGQQTVILVATRDEVNPDNPTYDNSYDKIDKDKPESGHNNGKGFKGTGLDLGPLCPPRCPCNPDLPAPCTDGGGTGS